MPLLLYRGLCVCVCVCVCVVTGMQAKYQIIYIYIYKEVMCYRGLTGIQVKEQHTEKWCRGITECRRKLYTQREVMCYRGLTTLQVKDKTTERNHVVHKWALSHGGQFPRIFKIFGVYLHPHITHAWSHTRVLARTHMHIKKEIGTILLWAELYHL